MVICWRSCWDSHVSVFFLLTEIIRVSGSQGFNEFDRMQHGSPSPMASSNHMSNVGGTGLGGWNPLQQEVNMPLSVSTAFRYFIFIQMIEESSLDDLWVLTFWYCVVNLMRFKRNQLCILFAVLSEYSPEGPLLFLYLSHPPPPLSFS